MGYGLLLIGYAVTFFVSLSLYGWMFRLLGYVIMAYGLIKLRDYFPSYALSVFTLIALFLTGLCEGAFEMLPELAPEIFKTVLYYVRDGLILLFHIFFLISTYIAYGVVDMKEKRLSVVTDGCAVAVGYILYVLSAFGLVSNDIAFFAQIIWMVMVFILILGCYMRICAEGDEDMPRRPSRFAFINRFSDALDKRENEAIARTRREIEEKKKRTASGAKRKRKKKK